MQFTHGSVLRRLSRGLLPALALTIGLAASHAARADVDQGGGFLKRRGYLHLAPGIMSVGLRSPTNVSYTWGISGGYHLPVTGNFIIEVGGFFDHSVATWRAHVFGIGPELRLGGGNSKIFGYGLIRLGAGISAVRVHHMGVPVGYASGASFLSTLGGGIQGLVHPHVALGGEGGFDVYAAGGVSGAFRLRFLIAILF